MGFSSFLKSRALLPAGNVVKSSHVGINSCSSSNELHARYVQPHQIPKRPYLQEEDMPVAFCRSCHVSHQKVKLQREKGVSDCSARLSSGRSEDSRRHWDSRVRKKSQKRLKSEKADCFALRKGITSLTCVNSVVKSVQILPEKGCLK